MKILTLICLLLLALVSVVALTMSAFGGFFLGMVLAFVSLIGCVIGADQMIRFL
jgi:hypothetical protein